MAAAPGRRARRSCAPARTRALHGPIGCAGTIELDLAELSFIDATGVQVILRADRRSVNGGRLVVTGRLLRSVESSRSANSSARSTPTTTPAPPRTRPTASGSPTPDHTIRGGPPASQKGATRHASRCTGSTYMRRSPPCRNVHMSDTVAWSRLVDEPVVSWAGTYPVTRCRDRTCLGTSGLRPVILDEQQRGVVAQRGVDVVDHARRESTCCLGHGNPVESGPDEEVGEALATEEGTVG